MLRGIRGLPVEVDVIIRRRAPARMAAHSGFLHCCSSSSVAPQKGHMAFMTSSD